MNLNDAIQHLTETLTNPNHEWSCPECKAEHEQLAEWLTELKAYKDNKASCENCKYRKVPAYEEPCKSCCHAYDNKFEWRGERQWK